MAPVLLIGRLPAANEAGRDKLIAGLGKIADYAKEHDPETTKHATHISRDPTDNLTVWAIEEYTSQEACDKHMEWPAVKEALATWEADPTLFAGAPEIWHSNQQAQFTRSELANAKDPFVLLAKLTYKDGKLDEGLEGWIPVVAYGKENEQGVLTYSVGKDVEHENRLTLCEAYESEKYLKEVHFNSTAVQTKIGADESLRAGEPDVVFLKHVAGYWHK